MTREEQIIQASDEWTYQKPPQYSELVHKAHKLMCAYQVGFIDGAVWADSHPRWISVEDELPEETDLYLVVQNDIVQAYWWFNGIKEWRENTRRMEGVTHWMPLPALPKKGGKQ